MSGLRLNLIDFPLHKKNSLLWICIFIILLGLDGCRSGQTYNRSSPKLPYKVQGTADPKTIALTRDLVKRDVRIISLGQNYLVSIPSELLFANESPRLHWKSYDLLNLVACYLREFRKIEVTVTAYSSKCLSPKREKALTLARSRAVAEYLWSQHIDSRFVFTQGLGSDKPIFKSTMGADRSENSRIEITFRDAVA